MRTALLLTAGLLLPAAPAFAHPAYDYAGHCSFTAATAGGDRWTGRVTVAVAATDAAGIPSPTTPVSVVCELQVDADRTVVLAASGVGAAAGAATLSYTAAHGQNVMMCERVTVGGEEHELCRLTGRSPTEPVEDLVRAILDELPGYSS